MRGPALILATAAMAVSGCAPALRMEALPVLQSDGWSGHAEDAGAVPSAPLAALLASPELAGLTEKALAHNAEVRAAEAREAQASALLRAARQATLPGVSASLSGSRDRALNDGLPDIRTAFASLDVTLDVDLFGKLRAQREAAHARVRSAELESDAMRLAVESDVAQGYVQRAALTARIVILDAGIARAAELERIVRVRVNEGAATKVDLGLQSIRLLNLREQRSRLAESLDQTRTALALLTGEEAPLFESAPATLDDIARPDLAPPSPAALLAARPDVGAAEALVEAAGGDVRAARAAFFPDISVSLTGLISKLVTGPLSKSVTVGSSLLAPIFSRGKLESQYAYASAVQVEAVERYRQAILTALKEAEDARGAIDRSAERAQLMADIAGQASETARLANLQYIEGEEDLLSVLDAQQLLNDAEDARVLATQEQLFARIALYRAAGGARAGTLARADGAPPRLAY